MIRREPRERRDCITRQDLPSLGRAGSRALCKIGWKEKEDLVVDAGTVAAASDQISDCFLPEGAGSKEGKKGGSGGGVRGVASGSCLLPASFPCQCARARGSPALSSAKADVFFRSKNKGTLERASQGSGLEEKKGTRQTRVLFTHPVELKQTPIPGEGG